MHKIFRCALLLAQLYKWCQPNQPMCTNANRATEDGHHRHWTDLDGQCKRKQCHVSLCVYVSVLNRKIVPNGRANRCSLCPSYTKSGHRPLRCYMVCDYYCTRFFLSSALIRFIVISSRSSSINIYAYASAIASKMELHFFPLRHTYFLSFTVSRFVFIHSSTFARPVIVVHLTKHLW